jgi:hypothetical protein
MRDTRKTCYAAWIIISLVALFAGAAHPQVPKKGKHYISSDGKASVSLVSVGKSGRENSESLIEFRDTGGKLLCGIDYSSSDGDYGFEDRRTIIDSKDAKLSRLA